jgi:hypothetical protein
LNMSATEITITKARNKTREDWMIAEQNLKRAMIDSLGLSIRHIIAPPPSCFQNMMSIDIIDAARAHYGKTTTRTVNRLDEILAEKLDNVKNFKIHAAKMQNASSIATTAGIPKNEIERTKLLRTSILAHHVMDKLIEGYDHDYPDFLQRTFSGLCDYLDTHMPNAELREADTKAHGLSVQTNGRNEDDILLSMNAEQITAYLAATNDAKKWKAKLNKQLKKSKRQQSSTTTSSDDDSEQPAKRPRVEHYCYCHGTQHSHTSAECKVIQADRKRFTSAMRNATNSQSPPRGSDRKPGPSQMR